jgi:hypothetical protein
MQITHFLFFIVTVVLKFWILGRMNEALKSLYNINFESEKPKIRITIYLIVLLSIFGWITGVDCFWPNGLNIRDCFLGRGIRKWAVEARAYGKSFIVISIIIWSESLEIENTKV